MPSGQHSTLASLLSEPTPDDYKILDAAEVALKDADFDPIARRIKVVALLKLDRFEDALNVIKEGGAATEEACQLEKCYASYKVGDLETAGALAGSSQDRSSRHVAAQVAYRAERFENAAEMYALLAASPTTIPGEESDLAINSTAVAAQGSGLNPGLFGDAMSRYASTSTDSFEVLYNIACGRIARQEFVTALELLRRAGHLCDSSEELSTAEKVAEMVPILIQQSYVFTKLGQVEEAERIHSQLVSYGSEDSEADLLVANNKSALESKGRNPFKAHRQIDSAPVASKDIKLFQNQQYILLRNRFAHSLLAQKYRGVERDTRGFLNAAPGDLLSDAHSISALGTAARSLNRCGIVSLRKVLGALETRPTDIGAALTAAQLHAELNRAEAALSVLECLLRELEQEGSLVLRYSPGLVALVANLYRTQGRISCYRRELQKASSYWVKEGRDRLPRSFLRQAGTELLRSPNPTDQATAKAIFGRLLELSRNDIEATAGLLASITTLDNDDASPYQDIVPSISKLTGGIDTESLIGAGVLSAQGGSIVASEPRSKRAPNSGEMRRRNKRRRLPKNYEEGKKVDPERWLPMRDRSSYRPKGKKAKRKANENTQGGFVREETLELAGGAGSVKVEKAPQASGSATKKKKKGKK